MREGERDTKKEREIQRKRERYKERERGGSKQFRMVGGFPQSSKIDVIIGHQVVFHNKSIKFGYFW